MTHTNAPTPRRARAKRSRRCIFKFRLYVAAQTPRSLAAIANLERICREHFPGRNSIEVVDLMVNPALAKRDQIVAMPTLVKLYPKPIRIVIGDLSNTEKVLTGLELTSAQRASSMG